MMFSILKQWPRMVLLTTLLTVASQAHADLDVKACGEPFPPYIHHQADDENNQALSGLHVALFDRLRRDTGIDIQADIIAWKRCLKSVAEFDQQGYEIALDATFNEERARDFYFVGPVYSASSAVFYSSQRHPNGLLIPDSEKPLDSIAEMQHYRICGALGWNYDVYYDVHGLPRTAEIDETPGPLGNVFKKIASDRCDVFESTTSLIAGNITTGELAWNDIVACQKLAIPPVEFYFMVSKKSPRAHELTATLGNALLALRERGEMKAIYVDGLAAQLGGNSALVDCL